MFKNKKNTKEVSVLQVLPHLDSGGMVSGAVEIATALKKNNFISVIASSGGYKENEILRHKTILEKIPVDSKNIFKVIANKNKLVELVKKHKTNKICTRSTIVIKVVVKTILRMFPCKLFIVLCIHVTIWQIKYMIINYQKQKTNS